MKLTPSRQTLLAARKEYSQCAAAVEATIANAGLSTGLSEQIVGIGVAMDWVRRAAEMDDILYAGEVLNNSPRKSAFVELTRFGFAWFGLNGIFSRPSLLHLVGRPSNTGEFWDFRVLFDAASIPNAAAHAATLQGILAAPTSPRLASSPPGASVSTLFVLDTKYIPMAAKKGAVAKAISSAATSGNVAALDLPFLVYAFRNWSVHGNALDGAFGSRPRFVTYVATLLEVLAEVHLSTAKLLRAAL